MKPLLILILSCLPLTALTVSTFVELGSDGDQPAPRPEIDGSQEAAARADAVRARVEARKPLIRALSEADLFAADPIPALRDAPDAGGLKPFGASWSRWVRARQVVSGVLEAEQLATALRRDLEQLEEAFGRLDELKTQYEDLLQKEDAAAPRESERLLHILRQRHTALKLEITRVQRQQEAMVLVQQARSAFRPQHYQECIELSDRTLQEYDDVLDASIIVNLQKLKLRAVFRDDLELLYKLRAEAASPKQHADLLRAFLGKYFDRELHTDAELAELKKCEDDLRTLEAQIEAANVRHEAELRIQQLHQDLPASFSQRVADVSRIIEQYPAADVKTQLREDVLTWLAECIPEKRLEEPEAIREAESKQHEIIRGFFAPDRDIEGRMIGYKCYPTQQELIDPRGGVGTYPTEMLLGSPAESVPRQCVTRFNKARDRLLERPTDRQLWTQLAALCDELQRELDQYRTKPGSSKENVSFAEDAAFLRQLVAELGWEGLEKLFEP
ncbi:MAG TPA: hypothetical protein VMY42_25740 [Thermoguttaceae bacterium]|nr:hypothetical protein [Thermoguttaceae bacterium]